MSGGDATGGTGTGGEATGGESTGTGGGETGACTNTPGAPFAPLTSYTDRDGGFGPADVTRTTADASMGANTVAIFRPAADKYGQGGVRHPLIVWGNGHTNTVDIWAGFLGRVATYGFVVVAPERTEVTADHMNEAIDYVLRLAPLEKEAETIGRAQTTARRRCPPNRAHAWRIRAAMPASPYTGACFQVGTRSRALALTPYGASSLSFELTGSARSVVSGGFGGAYYGVRTTVSGPSSASTRAGSSRPAGAMAAPASPTSAVRRATR